MRGLQNASSDSPIAIEVEPMSVIEKLTENKESRFEPENLLLAWLEYHYENQRGQDWLQDQRDILDPNDKRDRLIEKLTLNNFHEDLADGLVLIAVTGAYCPFLIDEILSKLYITPRNEAEVKKASFFVTLIKYNMSSLLYV